MILKNKLAISMLKRLCVLGWMRVLKSTINVKRAPDPAF